MIASRNLLDKVRRLYRRLSTRFRGKGREGSEGECLNGLEGLGQVDEVERTFVADIDYFTEQDSFATPFSLSNRTETLFRLLL